MRLLLDEHYAKQIAVELRSRGHEVVSLHDRPELLSLPDERVLAVAAAEGRAVLTENTRDFAPLARDALLAGESLPAIVYSSPWSMPRSAATIGLFVTTLDRLLRDHPGERALEGQIVWLRPPEAPTTPSRRRRGSR